MRKYGWKPDLPDHRDMIFAPRKIVKLPISVDLTPKMPPVFDQSQIGSCTANAILGAYQYLLLQKGISISLSRLFLYYQERAAEGTVNDDSGCQIRTGMKVLNSIGVCLEDLDPYDISKFKVKPSQPCYDDAKNRESILYHRVTVALADIQQALAQGYPVIFGATVCNSFESQKTASTGIVKYPTKTDKPIGGHAILIVGYDDKTKLFKVRNSWGQDWGKNGYCYFPYKYIVNTNLCDDFWVLQTVE